MDPESLALLREARDTRFRKEPVERAIGRTVRRRGLDFQRYLRLVSELRKLAESRKQSIDDVMAELLEGEKDQH
jgi:hypothetical protein